MEPQELEVALIHQLGVEEEDLIHLVEEGVGEQSSYLEEGVVAPWLPVQSVPALASQHNYLS